MSSTGPASIILYSSSPGKRSAKFCSQKHRRRAAPTASSAQRVRFVKDEQQNECALTYKISPEQTIGRCSDLEQVRGIEPPCSAWEADILPLNYTCMGFSLYNIPQLGVQCKGKSRLTKSFFQTSRTSAPSSPRSWGGEPPAPGRERQETSGGHPPKIRTPALRPGW